MVLITVSPPSLITPGTNSPGDTTSLVTYNPWRPTSCHPEPLVLNLLVTLSPWSTRTPSPGNVVPDFLSPILPFPANIALLVFRYLRYTFLVTLPSWCRSPGNTDTVTCI
ncbi:hypothetical protein CEXT_116921 [Caerostris extrusa]|uniref:Uncharacterized protein n=1 Tax=Caerostris extrusa TaxID=172846 RepID=A0AAV4Y197_CAEEX|nr:hypothetical protein CEXT_116921 [Caerostris extrusa]